MSKQYLVIPKSQADCNQLASLVHTHNLSSLERDPVTGKATYPFRVGQACVFWLYSSALHYNQYTAHAWDNTVKAVRDQGHPEVSVNDLAQELAVLF